MNYIRQTSNGVKNKEGQPDYILALTVGFLILLGLVILMSVSTVLSQEKFGSPTFYFFRHILVGLLPGILLGLAAFKIPLWILKKWAPTLLFINLFLMALVFLPLIGVSAGGASRWVNLGFASFQPSEFLKLTFILYLAVWLPGMVEKTKNLKFNLIAFLAVTGLIGLLLIIQPDISTLGIIVISAALMYFLTGTPFKHTFLIALIGMTGLFILIRVASYRFERFLVFLKPDLDPMGMSYQLKQALIAVGSGGIWGKGLGMSDQKFGFLPQPMADSIFAIFSEETGLIGGLVLISFFLVFAWRGFKIGDMVQDRFCQLTCFGISSWITLQAFINIGAIVGILPLTGIPLPFVSYGGSALIAELIGVGILLNISKQT